MAKFSDINIRRLGSIREGLGSVRGGIRNMADIQSNIADRRRKLAEFEQDKKQQRFQNVFGVVSEAARFAQPFLLNRQEQRFGEEAAEAQLGRSKELADYKDQLQREYDVFTTELGLDPDYFDRALAQKERELQLDQEYQFRLEDRRQQDRLELARLQAGFAEDSRRRDDPPTTEEIDEMVNAIEIHALDRTGLRERFYKLSEQTGQWVPDIDIVVPAGATGPDGQPIPDGMRYALWRTKMLQEAADDLQQSFDLFVTSSPRWNTEGAAGLRQAVYERVLGGGGADLSVLGQDEPQEPRGVDEPSSPIGAARVGATAGQAFSEQTGAGPLGPIIGIAAGIGSRFGRGSQGTPPPEGEPAPNDDNLTDRESQMFSRLRAGLSALQSAGQASTDDVEKIHGWMREMNSSPGKIGVNLRFIEGKLKDMLANAGLLEE